MEKEGDRLIPHADAWRLARAFWSDSFVFYPVLLAAMETFHLTVCPMRGSGLVSGLLVQVGFASAEPAEMLPPDRWSRARFSFLIRNQGTGVREVVRLSRRTG
jgi:hypothetical protein